jgi:hypothetical protein
MLSAEERRRLDEIERLLQVDDPRFVARMRAAPRRTPRWMILVAHCLLWSLSLVVGVLVNPLAGLCVAVVGELTAAAFAAVVAIRRRRQSRVNWLRDL